VDLTSRDIRRLGVSIDQIVLCDSNMRIVVGHGYAGLREGFHADEGCHRWTNGRACLPEELLGLFAGEVTVEVQVFTPSWSYPIAPPQVPATFQDERSGRSAPRSNLITPFQDRSKMGRGYVGAQQHRTPRRAAAS
jgi:hypothetical protein